MPSTDRGSRTALVLGVLALFILVAFWPALDNHFVTWDDERLFLHNENFRGLGWQQIRWASTTYLLSVFQPLSWLFLEAQFVGWGLNPRGYHAVSLGLHVVNGLLVFGLTRALFRMAAPERHADSPQTATLAAASTALLFAVHPLRVETVVWAAAQPYLIAFFFSVLALWAYLRVHGQAGSLRRRWWTITFVLTVAAMASKSVAVTLPVLFLVLDFFPLRRWVKGAHAVLLEKIPFLVVAAYFSHRAIEARAYGNSITPLANHGWGARIAHAAYSVLFYPAKTLLPVGLTPYYPLREDITLLQPVFLVSVVLVVALSLWFWRARMRRPILLASWASYLVVLLPNAGLIRISNQIAADRYAYVSFLGVTAALGALFWLALDRWRSHLQRGLLLTGIFLLAATCAWASRRQTLVWHDSLGLWTYANRVARWQDSSILSNYAFVLLETDKISEALPLLDAALKVDPNHVKARTNLAGAMLALQRPREAIDQGMRVLQLDPKAEKVHMIVGLAWMVLDQPAKAAQHLELAAQEEKNSYLQNRFALALFQAGKKKEAVSAFETAVAMAPGSAHARLSLAWAYRQTGNPDAAAQQLRTILESQPSNAVARYHLGNILLAKGRIVEGRQELEKAVQIDPKFEAAKKALADIAR
jgi:protein O-mannosyl-transferase